jgi:SAM-dependent methyltransferase
VNRPNQKGDDFLHKEFPKQFERDEFWRQIKRTVNGQPVTENDIEMIVTQIVGRLRLTSADHLLDLGCGNGALASRLFNQIGKYTGIDFSDYLLSIASEFFAPHNGVRYQAADIRNVDDYFVDNEDLGGNKEVSKALIYGCVAYLSKQDVASLLQKLGSKFTKLNSIFIGNIPNRKMAAEFFAIRDISDYDLDNPDSQIGVWWDVDALIHEAQQAGYRANCHMMPSGFYGHRYRFDLLLER